MLSLCELRRAAAALDSTLAGHRVRGIVQPGPDRVVLSTFGPGADGGSGVKRHVLFSCRSACGRVSLLAAAPGAPPQPPAFAQYLKAHVVGSLLAGARILDDDRQLALRLRARDGDFDLLLALLGNRSNVLLLDAAGCVAAALRPLAETRPELAPGDPWRRPESRPRGEGDDRFADVADADLLEAIEAAYAEREERADADALGSRIEQALRKEAKRLAGKLAKLEAELESAREAPRLEREGQLLKSVLSQLKRGDREAVARDWDSGDPVTIALDPLKSPSENLDAIFKRYQKCIRRLTKAGAQQEEVHAARDDIEALAQTFAGLSADEGALESFAAREEVAALLRRYAPAGPRPATGGSRSGERRIGGVRVAGRLVPRRYRASNGLEIWVGRSDAGNDYLSTRLARGKDLFFHLDGAPGSHVVLRTEGRSDPPAESVLDACELAVHFSKAKRASRADVHVVPIKNVKKPKGAKPGLVTVHGGKTVHLRRVPARLERLLGSRIEDDEG